MTFVFMTCETEVKFNSSIAGGGLISGVAVAAKALKPNIRIFAAEPKCMDDVARSEAGHIVTLTENKTIVDGLRASVGDWTW